MAAQLPQQDVVQLKKISTITIKRSIVCNRCKDSSNTMVEEPILFVPLLPRAGHLETLVRQVMSDRIDDRKCEKCGGVGAHQTSTIVNRPAVVCLQLCRSSFILRRGSFITNKDESKVRYKRSLDLTPFTVNQRWLDYELSSVVIHQGSSTKAGHYIATVKVGEQWHTFNDKSVKPSSEQAALDPQSGTPYLLFYRRR